MRLAISTAWLIPLKGIADVKDVRLTIVLSHRANYDNASEESVEPSPSFD